MTKRTKKCYNSIFTT